eukprot:CAMPEP_0206443210 /NCGR_PEP_ID=MMETSP0324_2-20121206/14244_1 /ASSEMBLY_ACC=CAM_ASM_000836 /TAXON_ID=2866 /ORGANISM="Crypthecodinium cohnii, Strain Seligo" /LENGTH=315 /DNA_ID=CAMNT_0053911125 /DNA_START=185 /DNA_END=1132 /DNA_ORIENTATION=+
MGLFEMIENASGIDLPDQIAGIDIPKPDLGDLMHIAGGVLSNIDGIDDIIEKATQVREIVACTRKTAGDCWGVIDRAQDVYDSVGGKIEPLEPLLKMDISRLPEAVSMFNKDTLDACIAVMGDVLDLGKLLQKMSDVLAAVKAIFEKVMEVSGDIIEQVSGFFQDVAEDFAATLHLESALDGIQDLWENLCQIISELSDISSSLSPVLEAWEDQNWFGAATFGISHFDEVKDAFMRFWPAWENCQGQYSKSRDIGENAWGRAKSIYTKYKQVLNQLCKYTGIDVPGGHDAVDEKAMPTIAPRGGFEIEEPFEPID